MVFLGPKTQLPSRSVQVTNSCFGKISESSSHAVQAAHHEQGAWNAQQGREPVVPKTPIDLCLMRIIGIVENNHMLTGEVGRGF